MASNVLKPLSPNILAHSQEHTTSARQLALDPTSSDTYKVVANGDSSSYEPFDTLVGGHVDNTELLRRKTPSGIMLTAYQSDNCQPTRPKRPTIIIPRQPTCTFDQGQSYTRACPSITVKPLCPCSSSRSPALSVDSSPSLPPYPALNMHSRLQNQAFGYPNAAPIEAQQPGPQVSTLPHSCPLRVPFYLSYPSAYPTYSPTDDVWQISHCHHFPAVPPGINKHASLLLSNALNSARVTHMLEGAFATAQRAYWQLRAHEQAGGQMLTPLRTSDFGRSLPCQQISTHIQQRASLVLLDLIYACEQSQWQWLEGINLAGCLAQKLGQLPEAIELYARALIVEPRHIATNNNLATALYALGRRQDAERIWRALLKHRLDNADATEHLVSHLCAERRFEDAIAVIQSFEDHITPRTSGSVETSSHLHAEPGSMRLLADLSPDKCRLLTLMQTKGRVFYATGRILEALGAFETAVLLALAPQFRSLGKFVKHIVAKIAADPATNDAILLDPEQALLTDRLCFPPNGLLHDRYRNWTASCQPKSVRLAISSALLSIAKIFQDGSVSGARGTNGHYMPQTTQSVLAMYYMSLSLEPNPSIANNIGILLAGVIRSSSPHPSLLSYRSRQPLLPGIAPGTPAGLAVAFYSYGLGLDYRHAHIYTNFGSLLKDRGKHDAAIKMYKNAIHYDSTFDIALANLANAVKDQGKLEEAIGYYRQALRVTPDFPEAACGLANAMSSVCDWRGRGGVYLHAGQIDRWHVDTKGALVDVACTMIPTSGWLYSVVTTVQKQLELGAGWGRGVTTSSEFLRKLEHVADDSTNRPSDRDQSTASVHTDVAYTDVDSPEGRIILRLVEIYNTRARRRWYHDKLEGKHKPTSQYTRLCPPAELTIPSSPTVLPFHAFTLPLTAQQVRQISRLSGDKVALTTLRAPWLKQHVYPPTNPPNPALRVGYISSDFNDHPLAHLMQSVFGFHDQDRVVCYCYATTPSDKSSYRSKIEAEAPHFLDVSYFSTEQIVNRIVDDGIHILVNLNGYTRGAKNEVFAARPAPVQMSVMGYAGSLGADWSDYLLADDTAVPESTLRPKKEASRSQPSNVSNAWVYSENMIFCRDSFFVCDHKQSAPDSQGPRLTWTEEQKQRWWMRKELFPDVANDTVIFANFNQLYKLDPTTFRTWLRILLRVPNSVLWLLRFPDLGEANLLRTAQLWAGPDVASRILFTAVAPKHMHISRARVCDLFLDTPECNAHTTAADVLWSGTPLLTLPRYEYKMCSRVAASILKSALPSGPASERRAAIADLIADTEEAYEDAAVRLGSGLRYTLHQDATGVHRHESGRLSDLRRMLFEARWTSALFDTRRWVRDMEDAYSEAWRKWVAAEEGDIYLRDIARPK